MDEKAKTELARECAEGIAKFTIRVRHVENYSGEHREWFEPMDIPAGNPFVIEAATPAVLAAINALDPQLVEAVGRDVAETWKAKAENLSAALKDGERQILDDIAIMMSKHVTNWPEPKKIKTAIALIDKTLAASSEAVGLLREALDDLTMVVDDRLADPDIVLELRALCERAGYGNVMSSASSMWRASLGDLAGGEFVAGPCRTTVRNQVNRISAFLAKQGDA